MHLKQIGEKKYKKIQKKLNLHPLQTYEWGELKKPNWKALRLGVYDDTSSVTAITILTRREPLLGRKFGYIPRGVGGVNSNLISEILSKIVQRYPVFTHLLFDPDVSFENSAVSVKEMVGQIQRAGFKITGSQVQPNRTVVLDLSKSEKDIMSNMRAKHRQYIRKAERNGVEVYLGTDNDVKKFCEVIRSIKREKKYTLHNCKYYEKVWDLFQENADLFIATKKEKVLGAYMLISNDESVYEMYGGCNREGNELLANYLLKWKCIKHFKMIGKKYYDQWGAEYKYPGLVQFKEGFGGKIINYPKQYVHVNNRLGFSIYKIFNRINELKQKVL